MDGVLVRVVSGRAAVVREVRAGGPLAARLRAPLTARGPWLTAVLNVTARRPRRPVAVVVQASGRAGPAGLALLSVRRGPLPAVTLLGDGVGPVPGGRPPARLLAADPEVAGLLAGGVAGVLAGLRGPWTLRLAGLPLGDPVARELAARLPGAALATARSTALVDDLGDDALRTRDPAVLETALPALLQGLPRREAVFLRACARLHAVTGALELAVVGGPVRPRAALLTLVDGDDRWPWWASGPSRTVMGAPTVSLRAEGGPRPALPAVAWSAGPAVLRALAPPVSRRRAR